MKKYLITTAVFLTGTALANAGTVLTTTFGNAAQATATNVTLTNTWADDLDAEVRALLGTVTASVTSLTNSSGAAIGLLTSNVEAGASSTFFSPNANVGGSNTATAATTGDPWTSVFSYSGTSGLTSIDGINFQVGLFNAAGKWQSTGASWIGNVVFTAQILDSSDSVLGSFTGKLREADGTTNDKIYGKGSDMFDVNLSGTTVVLDSVDTFKLKISLTETLESGTYVGLNSVAYSGSVIPEPSTFGLLAGLGALALAGTRRRRHAK